MSFLEILDSQIKRAERDFDSASGVLLGLRQARAAIRMELDSAMEKAAANPESVGKWTVSAGYEKSPVKDAPFVANIVQPNGKPRAPKKRRKHTKRGVIEAAVLKVVGDVPMNASDIARIVAKETGCNANSAANLARRLCKEGKLVQHADATISKKK